MKANKLYPIIFFGILILLFLLYQYPHILFLRPQSVHQWRQTICTSITLNYYQHGMNFFRPEVHILFSDNETSGQSLAELPLIYYINAVLWKIFGAREFISRLVNIAICLMGAFYLFRLLEKTLSPVWAILITLLLFSSPVVAFYGFGFMVDIPALFICFISAYYFFRYYESGKAKDIYAFMLVSLLTMLLKVTLGIFFLSVAGIFVFEKIRLIKFKHVVFCNTFRDGLLFLFTLGLVGGWYGYARHFDTIHGGWYTINDIFPIWDLDEKGITSVLSSFFDSTIYQFFYPASTFVFLLLFIGMAVSYKKIEKIYFVITILLTIGSFAYAILWFKVWNVHDYYLFLFLLPLVFVFISLGNFLKNNFADVFNSWKAKTIFSVFLVINIWYCSNNMRMRYGITTSDVPLMSTKSEMELWKWYDWNYDNTYKALETMEPYMRSLGISADDAVISIPDPSICITLYLMNQKGWTDYGSDFYNEDGIAKKIKIGAKYLILNDTSYASKPSISPYTKNKIGQYKNVFIYDLRN